MKIELVGGPLDGAVMEVPKQAMTLTVDSRMDKPSLNRRYITSRTYTIQFDGRRPLRALYVDLYPGDFEGG